MSETPRNQRNVEALAKAIHARWCRDAACQHEPSRIGPVDEELAQFLASRGVLGPASEVLEPADCYDLYYDYSKGKLSQTLERIAKGED